MKIKALILDAGGVMVKPAHASWHIPARYKEIMGEYADDFGSEKWAAAHEQNAHLIREDLFMPGDIDREYRMRREYFCAMAEDMNWKLTEQQLDDIAWDFSSNPGRYIWFGDVNPWLAKWHKKIKIGMLSDNMPSFRSLMASQKCDIYFDSILFSTDIGTTKPDAKMYETICNQLGVSPEECLFVDDREINLTGAQKCGVPSVQMDRENTAVRWNGPVVQDFEELNRFMEEMN